MGDNEILVTIEKEIIACIYLKKSWNTTTFANQTGEFILIVTIFKLVKNHHIFYNKDKTHPDTW